jgi:ribosome maturation factor RimP
VTVDDCADVSRQVSAILDVEDPIPGSYRLEVSSPGLDRPLVRPDDFRRFQGETIKVHLQRALDGRRNFTGRLVEVDNERYKLSFSAIERAKLVPQIK